MTCMNYRDLNDHLSHPQWSKLIRFKPLFLQWSNGWVLPARLDLRNWRGAAALNKATGFNQKWLAPRRPTKGLQLYRLWLAGSCRCVIDGCLLAVLCTVLWVVLLQMARSDVVGWSTRSGSLDGGFCDVQWDLPCSKSSVGLEGLRAVIGRN